MKKTKKIIFKRRAFAKDQWCEAGEVVEFNQYDADYFIKSGRAVEVKESTKAKSRVTKEEKAAKRTK